MQDPKIVADFHCQSLTEAFFFATQELFGCLQCRVLRRKCAMHTREGHRLTLGVCGKRCRNLLLSLYCLQGVHFEKPFSNFTGSGCHVTICYHGGVAFPTDRGSSIYAVPKPHGRYSTAIAPSAECTGNSARRFAGQVFASNNTQLKFLERWMTCPWWRPIDSAVEHLELLQHGLFHHGPIQNAASRGSSRCHEPARRENFWMEKLR